jgi:zinc/manganese transport system permease protein
VTGFFASDPVRVALAAGAVTAVVSGAVGVFTVVRGQSFAGHALGDLGTVGGSGAFLANINPLWGFVGVGAVVAAAMELFGVQRRRGRDVATGIVLGAVLGVSALLLYFDTTHTSTTGATVTVLFGSLFAVASSSVPPMVGLAAAGVVAVVVLYRPLLLSSLHPELASARGVPVRLVALGFLVLMGVTVSLTSMVVGTILSPALLVGPAACALRLSRRPGVAMVLAAAIGLVATWAGVALAYASATWPPSHAGWPVSFFVVALVFLAYLGVEAGVAVRT